MAPIRVGVAGLSATGSWAVKAHLSYLKSSGKYQITGVCNSSLASSEAAIKAHSLPPATTKAYGSISDLAASDDVDLVVVSTRVDRHYDALKVAIAAGKDCFVEWPLASNSQQASELLRLAEEKGVRTVVGLQGVLSPAIAQVKELLDSGAIGKVVSSHLELAAGMAAAEAPDFLEYLNYVEIGGNMLTIPFAHMFDSASSVLGELENVTATLSTQFPDVKIKSSDGSVSKTVRRTTADRITSSGLLANGAQSSAVVNGRAPLKGEQGLNWRIEGEKGIVDFRSPSPFAVSIGDTEVEIKLHDFATQEVKGVSFTNDRPGPPGNIGRIYEAFADGKWYPDWKWAMKRHAWVDAVYESDKSGKRVTLS
ncbi:hypothetical protein Q7P37_006549 [Cladosporium fusiforme]